MLTAVIVENEEPVARDFKRQLEKYASHEITVLAVAYTFDDALVTIRKENPDVLFLDIHLDGDKMSFDLLPHFDLGKFEVIFFTEHAEYSIRAMRVSALDYLIKPVIASELLDAIKRLKEKKGKSVHPSQIEAYQNAYHNPESQNNKIALPTMEGLIFVLISDIIYCQSDSNYTIIHCFNQSKTLVVSYTLKKFEDLLTTCDFFRIHASYLINLQHLNKYIEGDGGQVVIANTITLDVSKTYKSNFIKRVRKLHR